VLAVGKNGIDDCRAWNCDDPESLAISILTDYASEDIAQENYKEFIDDFICCLPFEKYIIPGDAIRDWLTGKINKGQAVV